MDSPISYSHLTEGDLNQSPGVNFRGSLVVESKGRRSTIPSQSEPATASPSTAATVNLD